MKDVVVITGGGSGIGLATAKYMDSKSEIIILSGRTVEKLQKAVDELTALGFEAYPCACDTSNRDSVKELVKFAASKGIVKKVINAAGLSPTMADPEKLMRVNALGTVYINSEFRRVLEPGSVIVDIASNSAYSIPMFLIDEGAFALADKDEERFLKKSLSLSKMMKDKYKKAGLAYAMSKAFVVWYAQKCAFEYGRSGIRVVSLSPGLIATDMGNLESSEGGKMLKYGAEERMGKPEELGFAIASLADARNGYLAGVDVLCDGGCTNGKMFRK